MRNGNSLKTYFEKVTVTPSWNLWKHLGFSMDLPAFIGQSWVKIESLKQVMPSANQSTKSDQRGNSWALLMACVSWGFMLVVGKQTVWKGFMWDRWVMLRSGFYPSYIKNWLQVTKRAVMWSKQSFGGLDIILKRDELKGEKCKGTKNVQITCYIWSFIETLSGCSQDFSHNTWTKKKNSKKITPWFVY